jgi:hypothetical protein
MGVENGFVLGQEIDRGWGRVRGGVAGEPVLNFFNAARPALSYDVGGDVDGGWSVETIRSPLLRE